MISALVLAINFAAVPNAGTAALGLALVGAAGARGVRDPAEACCQPALRPLRGVATGLLGRGLRRHHRLRLVDGLGVRGTAVPAERPELLDDQFRRCHLAGGHPDGDRGAAVGQADRIPRFEVHAALRLRVLPARVPHDAPPVEGEHPVLEGGPRVRVRGHRGRIRGTRAHSLTGSVRRARVVWPRVRPPGATWAAPSCRSIRGALLTAGSRPRSGAAIVLGCSSEDQITDSVASQLQKSLDGASPSPSSTRSTPRRSPRQPRARSCRATCGPTLRASSPCCWGRSSVFFMFPKKDEEVALVQRYHDGTHSPRPRRR